MNFFSWHFPLHEFFLVFSPPPPPNHFSNGPSLRIFNLRATVFKKLRSRRGNLMDKMQELGRSRKQHSLTFSVNEVDTSQDIIVGFDKTGIDIDIMISIQRKASNNTWVVSFDSKEANDAALNEPWITIAMSFGGTARTRLPL